MENKKSIANNILIFVLAITSIFLLAFDVLAHLSEDQKLFIHNVDLAIALFFLIEFIYQSYSSKNWRKYLYHHWWELLAAIPITTHLTQTLRALRLARFVPLLETIRLIRLSARLKILLNAIGKSSKYAYAIYILVLLTSIITGGALGFYRYEFGVNPNVHGFFDSLWWAVVTITTIGYGDIYPVTTGGRVVAMILMVIGIGALGAFIGLIDYYVISKNRKKFFQDPNSLINSHRG